MDDHDANFECVDCAAGFAHTSSGACLDCGGRLRDGNGQVVPVTNPEPTDADETWVDDDYADVEKDDGDDAFVDRAPGEVTVDRMPPRSLASWIAVGAMATVGLVVVIGAYASLGQNNTSGEPIVEPVVVAYPTTTTSTTTSTTTAAPTTTIPPAPPPPARSDTYSQLRPDGIYADDSDRDNSDRYLQERREQQEYWQERQRQQEEDRERREREQWEQEREQWERDQEWEQQQQEQWQYEQEQRQRREQREQDYCDSFSYEC